MKKSTKYYYTVTQGIQDSGRSIIKRTTIFRSGIPLKDRRSALLYFLQVKSEFQYEDYNLSVHAEIDADNTNTLTLIRIDRRGKIEVLLSEEVNFLTDIINEREIEFIGDYPFIKGFSEISEFHLIYKIEIAVQKRKLESIPELKSNYGIDCLNNALINSVIDGDLGEVKYCHAYGADLSFNNNLPLRVSISLENPDIFFYLVDFIPGWQSCAYDLLNDSAYYCNHRVMKFLVENYNFCQYGIRTALDKTKLCSFSDSVKLLLSRLDDPEETIEKHVLYACSIGAYKKAHLLLDYQPSLLNNLHDIVHMASEKGMLSVLERLFKDYNVLLGTCTCCLNMAILNGRNEVIEFLIEMGVPINDESARNLIIVLTEGVEDPDSFFGDKMIPQMDFLIEHIISKIPESGILFARFFTQELNKKYPDLATAVDFNII